MNRTRIPRPSAALLIACVALFSSLAGGATAATMISGKQVKDASITGKDVKDRSLTSRDFKAAGSGTGPGATGTLQAQGLAGARGPAGPKGDTGAAGAAGAKGEAGAAGRDGSAGANGATGGQGPQGPQGPQGVPGLSQVETVTASNRSNQVRLEGAATAVCPAGKKVIGGGVENESEFGERKTGLVSSRPLGDNAWYGKARTYEAATGINMTVYAICAKVG